MPGYDDPNASHALREKLVTEAENLARNHPYVPFGHGFKTEAKRLRESKRKPEGAVPLSITGKSPPENFSPAELFDIVNNETFAQKVFQTYTGKRASQRDIESLRERIRDTYPDIMESGNPDNAYDLFNSAWKIANRRDNPDIKPLVNFFVDNPEIAEYAGYKRTDNLLLPAAERLKQSGYQNPKDIETVKNQASLYLFGKNEDIDGQRGRHEFLRNISLTPQEFRNTQSDSRDKSDYQKFSASIQDRLHNRQRERDEDVVPRLREASRLEKLASGAERNMDRIAPLGESHEQAKELLNRNLDSESLRLAIKEIKAASKMDVKREVAPYLEKSVEAPDEFINRYENRYEDVIEGFRKEAAKDFLENDLPKINRQFASKGAFYSGAREATLNKARANKEERIEREIARLRSHGRDEAMKHYNEQRRHMLGAAEIAGKTLSNKQDAALKAAESLRVNAETQKGAAHRDVAALEQVARTEQEQAQNALNVRLSEYREQQERPWEELQRKSAIAAAHPMQPMQYSPQYVNPTPPNVYGMGAGMLGQMMGLQRMQGGQFRKGGHVRARYADGGSVARTAAELKEIQHHTQEPNEYEQEMLSEARGMRNNRVDPMGNYLFALGSHMIANNREDPSKTYGEGSMHGMNAFNQANAQNLSAKEKYVNLLSKINESRGIQQKYFSQYHLNKMAHEETVRAHNAHLAETKRHHDVMHQRDLAKMQQESGNQISNPYLPSFPSKEAEKAYYKREGKLKESFDQEVKETEKLGKSTRRMMNLFSKGIGDTGPVSGRTPEFVLNKFYNPETIANRRLFEKEFTKNVLDIMNQAKGNQTDSDREYMARTTVSLKDDPLTIKRYLQDSDKVIKRNEEAIHYIESEMEKGVPIEQAQKQWKKYVEENPLFGEEESNASPEGNRLVKMVAPDGSEAMVPRENVQAAISAGASIL